MRRCRALTYRRLLDGISKGDRTQRVFLPADKLCESDGEDERAAYGRLSESRPRGAGYGFFAVSAVAEVSDRSTKAMRSTAWPLQIFSYAQHRRVARYRTVVYMSRSCVALDAYILRLSSIADELSLYSILYYLILDIYTIANKLNRC
jgi:hypothetical protein